MSAESSSVLVLVDVLCELVEVVLVNGPCELDVDPDCRGDTGTGGRVFEDVPSSFCGTPSSSSESVDLRLFALGKSRGFFTSAELSFPFAIVDFLFLVANLDGHSCDLVVPLLLTHQRYKKVPVQVLVVVIWIFVVFQSYQSLHQAL